MLSRLTPWKGDAAADAADEGREEKDEADPLTLPPLRVLPFPANELVLVEPTECFSMADVSLFLSAPRMVSITDLFLMKTKVGIAETPYARAVAWLASL